MGVTLFRPEACSSCIHFRAVREGDESCAVLLAADLPSGEHSFVGLAALSEHIGLLFLHRLALVSVGCCGVRKAS